MRSLWTYSALLMALVALALLVSHIVMDASGQTDGLAWAEALIHPTASAISCAAIALVGISVLRFAESEDMFLVVCVIAMIPLAATAFPHGLIFTIFVAVMAQQVKQSLF